MQKEFFNASKECNYLDLISQQIRAIAMEIEELPGAKPQPQIEEEIKVEEPVVVSVIPESSGDSPSAMLPLLKAYESSQVTSSSKATASSS